MASKKKGKSQDNVKDNSNGNLDENSLDSTPQKDESLREFINVTEITAAPYPNGDGAYAYDITGHIEAKKPLSQFSNVDYFVNEVNNWAINEQTPKKDRKDPHIFYPRERIENKFFVPVHPPIKQIPEKVNEKINPLKNERVDKSKKPSKMYSNTLTDELKQYIINYNSGKGTEQFNSKFETLDNPGDGDCLFHSLLESFNVFSPDTNETVESIRESSVEKVKTLFENENDTNSYDKENFLELLNGSAEKSKNKQDNPEYNQILTNLNNKKIIADLDTASFDEVFKVYADFMKTPKKWAGDFELLGASKLFEESGLIIILFNEITKKFVNSQGTEFNKVGLFNNNKNGIFLTFNGYHYKTLKPIQYKKKMGGKKPSKSTHKYKKNKRKTRKFNKRKSIK
jgi:hypothetical protein